MSVDLTHEEYVRVGLVRLRILTAMPAAVVATLVLLWGMERLIRADENLQVPEPEIYKVPDPVMVEPPPPQVLYNRPKPPDAVEIEPAFPELDLTVGEPEGNIVALAPAPPAGVRPTITNVSGDTPVATMLIQPSYPSVAANKGLEGYVDVEFDVTETGATANVRILKAEPAKVFERETIKAVKRWKFSPVVRDGQPVAYIGMVQRVHFQMEKG